ncbi:hypothetical protein OSB04_005577 [Centaurea solstitialis]|uniref:Reverse transcriptase domain-containing protein n=1 Tax=Centaurea solstitialis TaxID=347529 RepID=A0AA38WGY0_9ASTR|nr:hypothetical protein OSB04_005577 [Centaurea solstitialis]
MVLKLRVLRHIAPWRTPWRAFFNTAYPYERNRRNNGGRLDISERRYGGLRGSISTHPESEWGRACRVWQGAKEAVSFLFGREGEKVLQRGCKGYLAYAVNDQAEGRKLLVADVPVVSEYPDVFPEDLPGIPPDRQIKFGIDLVPGAAPVAKTPYRLAPPELQELSSRNYRRRDLSVRVVRRGAHRSCS